MADFNQYELNLENLHELPANKSPGSTYWQQFFKEEPSSLEDLLFNEELTEDQKIAIFKKFVCIVAFETSTYCNRKCEYCPDADPKYGRNTLQNLMSERVFLKSLGELRDIQYNSTISLNLYNEAMADESIYERIAQARDNLPSAIVKFNSNGDYLNARSIRRLESSGLDAIFITLHPQASKRYDDDDRIRHYNNLLKRIGAPSFEIKKFESGKRFFSEFKFRNLRVVVMAENWMSHGTSRGDLIEKLKSTSVRNEPCWRPFREFTISQNGSVWPCCQVFPDEPSNSGHIIGNVSRDTLWEIYSRSKLKKWQQHLVGYGPKSGVCASCTDPCYPADNHQAKVDRVLKNGE